MTGKIINLRSLRKAKARDAKRQASDENAARHGRSRSQRNAEEANATAQVRHLDGHKRDPGTSNDDR